MIITVPKVDSKDKAEKLVGKTVNWTTPGKEKKIISGKVTGSHGNKGSVKALFERGLPGQSLGQEVKIE
ncbi:50S ribosomal protein L35ae [Nanoarchaeota archaeon]